LTGSKRRAAARIIENSLAPQSPSAAKAVAENMPVIAAVNRCATQKQEQIEFFSKRQERAC
jgi:hypothetical protein